MRVLRYGLVTTMVMALFQAYLGAEELVRSRVAILAMHEPREVSYYEDLRRSVYERWSLRIIRGIDRFTGLRMDGNDWTFRLVALGLLALVTALLFWGFTTPRRRTLAYSLTMQFPDIHRITLNPNVMGGKPCIRGMRVTVGTLTGLLASGITHQEILTEYPYLEEADIRAALMYASWRSQEMEVLLESA